MDAYLLKDSYSVQSKFEMILKSNTTLEDGGKIHIEGETIRATKFIIEECERQKIQINVLFLSPNDTMNIYVNIPNTKIRFNLYINYYEFAVEVFPEDDNNGFVLPYNVSKAGLQQNELIDKFIVPIKEVMLAVKKKEDEEFDKLPSGNGTSTNGELKEWLNLMEHELLTDTYPEELKLKKFTEPILEENPLNKILSELTEINKTLLQDIYQQSLSGIESQMSDIKMELKETNRILLLLCQK